MLQNRDVTIWPDNDRGGINAAAKITDILKAQGNQEVKIVDLPPTLPQKWDLADKIPDGMNAKEMLTNAIVPVEMSHKVEPTHDHSQVKQEQPNPLDGKIDQIIQQHKLDIAFSSLNSADYQHVHKIFDVLKEAYQAVNIKIEDDWVLKRATFMVHTLREFSHMPMKDDERARTCLVAATIFANQHQNTDTAATYDNHFKALAVINTHNRNRDIYIQAESRFKEMFGFQPNAPFDVRQNYVPDLSDKIFAQIKQVELHYQQRNLEIASKALDMQKSKGLEL